jgi:hypothetical protein
MLEAFMEPEIEKLQSNLKFGERCLGCMKTFGKNDGLIEN